MSSYTGKAMLGMMPGSPYHVFASVANRDAGIGLYRSTDFGTSWSLRNTTNYAQYQGWYSHAVAISPTDSNEVVFGGIDMWRSSIAGLAPKQESFWTLWNTTAFPVAGPERPTGDYVHADIHDIQYDPDTAGKLYVASDGGIFVSRNGRPDLYEYQCQPSNSTVLSKLFILVFSFFFCTGGITRQCRGGLSRKSGLGKKDRWRWLSDHYTPTG